MWRRLSRVGGLRVTARRSLACAPACSDLPLQPALARHLDGLVARHVAIEAELEGGEAAFSAERMKELARLGPIVELRHDLASASREAGELRELVADAAAEAELRQIARDELREVHGRLEALEDALIALLVPPEEGDECGAVLEVRAGVGGDEAGLFAAELLGMYEKLARRRRWRFDLHDVSETDVGGTREATASISGTDVYGTLRSESGVHRVQRVPATESLGRVHTSTAVVVVLPAADEGGGKGGGGAVELNPADITVDVFRASGAGGQHVNTTESAVRLTHRPTGIKVSCQNERSQHQNKASAMKLLRARVMAYEEHQRRQEQAAVRDEVDSTGARSERIRTYNYADDRVTDHRLKSGSKFGLPRMLEGEMLEELADELQEMSVLSRRDAFVSGLKAK